MPTFNTQAEILKYAQSLINNSQRNNNSRVREAVGKTVSRAVETEVYAKYDPKEYDRRGRNGGLADERNVEVISVQSSGNTTRVELENLTEGNDSMIGRTITDMIETGEGGRWYNTDGVWSEPRPFIDTAVENLRNSNELKEALKQDLIAQGLDVK